MEKKEENKMSNLEAELYGSMKEEDEFENFRLPIYESE
jgi:hypothetical protein